MSPEKKLPLRAKVFGIATLGAAAFVAACGGRAAKDEAPSQPTILPPNTEAQIPPTATTAPEPEVIASEQNLIKDSSFESGDWRNHWEIEGFVDLAEKKPRYLSIDNSQAHSGSASLRLTIVYDQQSPYEPQGICDTEFLYAASTHGFYPVSEITVQPGTYEFGMWVKSNANVENYSVGVRVSFFPGQEIENLSRWPGKPPRNWQRISAFIQVPPEVTALRPRIGVVARPGTSDEPCGTVIDVWVDDVFLVPVTPPPDAQVLVLQDPFAIEKFGQAIKEKAQPFIDRATALSPKMLTPNRGYIISFLADAPQEGSKARMFYDYEVALQFLLGEYQTLLIHSPENAPAFLSLVRDLCNFMQENLPEESKNERLAEHYNNCNIE